MGGLDAPDDSNRNNVGVMAYVHNLFFLVGHTVFIDDVAKLGSY
jgi:hypothetical protein